MAITTAQIRGARGILDWTQQDLSSRTGISSTSIGAIEKGDTTPRENTLNKIQQVFEDAGIEFIGLDGVRLRTGDVRIYKGKQGFINFYDDVYNTVKGAPSEILVSNVDERKFVKILDDYAKVHVDRITALGNVKYKILVQEGDFYVPGSDYAEYRWIPAELFASVPFYIYNEKLAVMFFDGEPSIIVMQYASIANAYKVQFFDMWTRARAVDDLKAIKTLKG